MAHAGTLGSYRFSQGVDDIRGTTVYGADDEKIGKVDDVIFDHATMEIRYLVVDSGGWLEAGKFLIPIDQVYADAKHKDNFAVDITKQQIKSFPRYNEKSLRSADQWKKYEDEFKKFWEESPVMHQRDSYRIITPPEEPSSAAAEASQPLHTCESEGRSRRQFTWAVIAGSITVARDIYHMPIDLITPTLGAEASQPARSN